MDGSAILNLINGLSPGGTLTLTPGSSLNAPRIDALLSGVFGGKLVAKLGNPDVTATSVSFAAAQLEAATFSLYPVSASVPAVLTVLTGNDGALDLTLSAALPGDWTFAASFPAIGKLNNAAINDLALSKGSIAVDSAASATEGLLTASIDAATSAIADFAWLLGSSVTVTGAAGFVTDSQGTTLPSFTLSSPAINGPQVAGFTFAIYLNLRCGPGPAALPDGSTPIIAEVDLTAALTAGSVTIPILIGVTGKGQTRYPVRLDPNGKAPQLNSLEDLSGFTFNASPGAPLAAANTPIGKLSFDYLSAAFDTASRSISNVMLQISLGTSWSVIDNIFELDGLFAQISVPTLVRGGSPPGGGPGFSVVVGARIALSTANLIATASYPDEILSVALAPGTTVDINAFMGRFARNVSLPGSGDLSIVVFSALADIKNGSYSLSTEADGSLTVISGFTLTEINMAIDYANGAVASFAFACAFTIAGAPLVMDASYSGSDKSWALQGGSEPGKPINLTALLADLLTIFGVSFPSNVPAIILSVLNMSYDTGTGGFGFDCEIDYFGGDDAILKKVTGKVSVTRASRSDPTTGQVLGAIEIGNNLVTATLDFNKAVTLALQWKAEGNETVGIADLCNLVQIPAPDIPSDLDLALTQLDGAYDITNKVLMLGAVSKTWGAADLILWNDTSGWNISFALRTGKTISLANLPLVGKAFSAVDDVALSDIQVDVARPPLGKDQASKVSGYIDELDKLSNATYPKPPPGGMTGMAALTMTVTAGSAKTPISIGTPASSGGGTKAPAASLATSAPAMKIAGPVGQAQAAGADDGTKWFSIQKSFGPVSIQKIGVRYSDKKLWALMNADLAAGPVTIGLIGLGMGSPLNTFSPHFTVDGITIGLSAGPITFSGALVGQIDPVDLYGELSLTVSDIGLGALAGYANYEGHPSFFLYAVLDAPIGGPAFFFVTGLAAGFGFNRTLVVPDVGGLSTFPLIQWATQGGQSSTPTSNVGDQVMQAMTTLKNSGVIAPSIGEYWFAVGVKFTSFELIDSFALLTVILGDDVEIDLLGLSSLSLPPKDPAPLALAELALKASFQPSHHLISVSGQLTSRSFVLARECHITGGFAFYMWYAGDHAGEFVLSIGGYSPHFGKPDYYPDVPRLGLNWQISGDLSITGDEYFALTASAVMAGGGMSAVWQSGPISAWFSVQADFLLMFAPLHYYISASIQLGASVKIDLWFTSFTISIHLGVSAEIWGPQFSGEVDVDLDIVSFTISFGPTSRGAPEPLAWDDFVGQMLPKQRAAAPQVARTRRSERLVAPAARVDTVAFAADPTPPPTGVQMTAKTGLLKTLPPVENDPDPIDWLVDPKTFVLTVATTIPLKTYTLTAPHIVPADADKDVTPNQDFGIGPTSTTSDNLASSIVITATTNESSVFDAFMNRAATPKAVWEKRDFDGNGVPQNVDPVNGTTIDNVLTGFDLVPTVPPPKHSLPIDLINLQFTTVLQMQTLAWSVPAVQTSDPFTPAQTVVSTIGGDRAKGNRSALIDAINRSGFAVRSDIDVAKLADPAATYLLASPALRYLGEAR